MRLRKETAEEENEALRLEVEAELAKSKQAGRVAAAAAKMKDKKNSGRAKGGRAAGGDSAAGVADLTEQQATMYWDNVVKPIFLGALPAKMVVAKGPKVRCLPSNFRVFVWDACWSGCLVP